MSDEEEAPVDRLPAGEMSLKRREGRRQGLHLVEYASLVILERIKALDDRLARVESLLLAGAKRADAPLPAK